MEYEFRIYISAGDISYRFSVFDNDAEALDYAEQLQDSHEAQWVEVWLGKLGIL